MRKILTLAVLLTMGGVVNAQDGFLTAGQYYNEIEAAVKDAHGDNVSLLMAMSIAMPIAGVTLEVNVLEGKGQFWMYIFHSPDEGLAVTAMAIDHPVLGKMVTEAGTEVITPDMDTTTILPGWSDSDAAAAAMLGFGLQSYLDARPTAKGVGFILAPPPPTSFEHALWVGMAGDDIDTLQCMVDAVTLEEFRCTVLNAVEELQTAQHFQLAAPYPNPVRRGAVATVELSLDQPTHIRVSLYDAMGRCLGIIAEQRFEAGSSTLAIPSTLLPPSGIVFVTAESEHGISTRKLLIAP